MAILNLLDIAKLNGNDKVIGLIEENLTAAPELERFPMRRIRGTNFYTVKRTGFPSVAFRTANAGVTKSKSTFAKMLTECFILSSAVEIDRAVGEASEDGIGAVEMIEASGVMKQSLITIGSQIWYGVSADANGFPGIKSLTPHTAAAGLSTNVVNAAGSTATTASSLYAVKYGSQNVELVLGNNGSFDLSPFRDQTLFDSATPARSYPGRVAELTAWTGLSVQNVNCVGRIYNLTEDSGKGLTDALIANLLRKFPVGYVPDALYCSRRSRYQLQVSRTVTINANGNQRAGSAVENIAPLPTEAFGIPLIATDSILDTDAINS